MKNRTRFMRLKKREHRPEAVPVLTTAERALNPNHAKLIDLASELRPKERK